MSIKHLLRTVAVAAPVTLAIGSFALISTGGTASAAGPVQQSATIDATNDGGQTVAAGKPFSSGQLVSINVPPSVGTGATGEIQPNTNFTIYECSDPGGLAGNLPTSVANCDSNTAEGTNGTSNPDGSVQYTGYEVFALPNTESPTGAFPGLGETAGHLPVCNTGNPCVLAVITDPNNFSDPSGLAFSTPFLVTGTNDSGANPGDGTPEAPLAIGLPLVGLAAVGGVLYRRRRNAMKANPISVA
jgi:hypothetical protein